MGRPDAVIERTWKEYRSWALTAREAKAAFDKARDVSLGLGLAGTLAAVLAGVLTDVAYVPQALAAVSAVAIAVAGWMGREFLSPASEGAWVQARLRAEHLKRQCYLALMGISPYDGADAGDKLGARLQACAATQGLAKLPADGKPLPEVHDLDSYIADRLVGKDNGQIVYYRARAEQHRVGAVGLRRWSQGCGAAAVVLSAGGAILGGWVAAFVPLVTAGAAAVAALMQATRHGSLVTLYQDTELELGTRLALLRDRERSSPATKQESANFVQLCEDIMSRENSSWRAGWLDREQVEKRLEALRQARAYGDDVGVGGEEDAKA